MASLYLSLGCLLLLVLLVWAFIKAADSTDDPSPMIGCIFIIPILLAFIFWIGFSIDAILVHSDKIQLAVPYLLVAATVVFLAFFIPLNSLFVSTYTLRSLKNRSPEELSRLLEKHPRLFQDSYRSSIRDDTELAIQAVFSDPRNYAFASERIRSDPEFALRAIPVAPDVIEQFSPDMYSHPSISGLIEDKEFVLEVTSTDTVEFIDSSSSVDNWRRLRYLPEHWRADKEVILAAVGGELEVFPDCDHDQLFQTGLEDLFALVSDELLRDPEFLSAVEELMIEAVQPLIEYFHDYFDSYLENAWEQDIEMGVVEEGDEQDIPDPTTLAGLQEYFQMLEDGWWDPRPEPENTSNPIPDRLLNALSEQRQSNDSVHEALPIDQTLTESVSTKTDKRPVPEKREWKKVLSEVVKSSIPEK